MNLYSDSDIKLAESRLGFKFPSVYADLLASPGSGPLNKLEIYDPYEIYDLYSNHFDDPDAIFTRWFPIGCDNQKQEIWIVDVSNGLIASIYHECNPDDWEEEEWLDYNTWLRKTF